MIVEKALMKALGNLGIPTRCTVLLSDRNGVEPVAPYILSNIIDQWNIGASRKTSNALNGKLTESVTQTKEFNISLTLHALATDDIHDWFEWFHVVRESDLVQWTFYQEGLGLVNAQEMIYQSLTVDNKNYKRAIMDLVIRSDRHEEVSVNIVKNINTTGNLGFSPNDVEVNVGE